MKKIAHLSTVHYPLDNRIYHKQCESLARSGFDVHWVCCNLSKLKLKPDSKIKFIDLGNTKNRFHRVFIQSFQALAKAIRLKADLYHLHDPELLPVGMVLRMMGKKVVYDVHEDYPAQFKSKEYLHPYVRQILSVVIKKLERVVLHLFSGIVITVENMQTRFHSSKAKVVLVQNFPRLEEFDQTHKNTANSSSSHEADEFKIVYIGGIFRIRAIREIVRALELIPAHMNPKLILGGPFSPANLYDEVSAYPGWKYVDYKGYLDRDKVAEYMASAHVGLVLLYPIEAHMHCYPQKIFEYMAAGLPIVASDIPYWEKFIEDPLCGVRVNPKDPQQIAAALCDLYNRPDVRKRMSENGLRVVREKYSWESEYEKLVALYTRILQITPAFMSDME